MAHPHATLNRLGFLTIGLFDPAHPAAGHDATLEIIELGETLGFDSAWLRHRHLQFGISSPIAVMAAASQRTSRIELGTAVTPLGAENPFRLAEDLATVDVLSGGRISPGFSTGNPMRFDAYKEALYPGTWQTENLGYDRLLRLRSFLLGDVVSDSAGREGIEDYSDRVEPYSPGLADRLWYGAASLTSARWAGENGFRLLTSSVIAAENGTDFAANQSAQIREYRRLHPQGEAARVSQGLVVIPTDSATASQHTRYRDYVRSRAARVGVPQGPGKLLFAADLIGSAAEIAEQLQADAGYREVDEVAFALPFSFEKDDYAQLLTDIAGALAPALGWSRRPATVDSAAPAPGIYRHHKGALYEVLGRATHSETEEAVVVYRALYGDFGQWVRPVAMFTEQVEVDGVRVPRFAPVG